MGLKDRVRVLAIIFAAALVLPLINIVRYAVFESDELMGMERCRYNAPEKNLRGRILDRDGEPVAMMSGVRRCYPLEEAAAPLLGYANAVYGCSGMEAELSGRLRGYSVPRNPAEAVILLSKSSRSGDDVMLSINSELQKCAFQALGEHRGAAVVINVSDGSILAMASSPSYNPDYEELRIHWKELNSENSGSPFVERASQGSYPPGSVFKILTMSAALEEKITEPSEHFYCSGSMDAGNFVLKCHSRHNDIDLDHALAKSCNVAFGVLGGRLGIDKIYAWMKRFHFDSSPALVPGAMKAHLPEASSPSAASEAAIGQSDLMISPLQAARMCAVIARGGVDIEPRLILAQLREGTPVWQADSPVSERIVSEATAAEVCRAMELAVMEGTACAAAQPGTPAAGKTGSAENSQGPTHAWFAGFIPSVKPRYAVAVILENAGGGGEHAAPAAGRIFAKLMQMERNGKKSGKP